MSTPPVAVKLGSTTTTGGFGVGAGVTPPLLQPRKPILKTKIKILYLINAIIIFTH
jgi:hypothetical protein